MDRYRDWTLDTNNFADLPDLVNDLHSYGMHFIPIVVSLNTKSGKEQTFFVKLPS